MLLMPAWPCRATNLLLLILLLPLLLCAVDEGEREQGIAHLVEHVTFLGSKKREGLLGTGARWAAGRRPRRQLGGCVRRRLG